MSKPTRRKVEYHRSNTCQIPPDTIWNIASPIYANAHETLLVVYEILDVQYMSKPIRRKVEYHRSNTCSSPPDATWNITGPIYAKAHQTQYGISQVQC